MRHIAGGSGDGAARNAIHWSQARLCRVSCPGRGVPSVSLRTGTARRRSVPSARGVAGPPHLSPGSGPRCCSARSYFHRDGTVGGDLTRDDCRRVGARNRTAHGARSLWFKAGSPLAFRVRGRKGGKVRGGTRMGTVRHGRAECNGDKRGHDDHRNEGHRQHCRGAIDPLHGCHALAVARASGHGAGASTTATAVHHSPSKVTVTETRPTATRSPAATPPCTPSTMATRAAVAAAS